MPRSVQLSLQPQAAVFLGWSLWHRFPGKLRVARGILGRRALAAPQRGTAGLRVQVLCGTSGGVQPWVSKRGSKAVTAGQQRREEVSARALLQHLHLTCVPFSFRTLAGHLPAGRGLPWEQQPKEASCCHQHVFLLLLLKVPVVPIPLSPWCR